MSQRVVRIAPFQAAKVFGVIYLIIGLIVLPVFALPILLGNQQQPFSMGVAIFIPIFYGLAGFVGTAFGCWLYNLVAARVGGIELELSDQTGP